MFDEHDYITFQVSAKTYAGFKYPIPKIIANNMTSDDIVRELKNYMKNFFESHNLYLLKDGINNLNLHMHDTAPFKQDVIYVCDHSHSHS